MFFGRKQQYEKPGMSMKTKFILLLVLVFGGLIFKDPILAHFGIETKPAGKAAIMEEEAAPDAVKYFPKKAMTNQSAQVFQEPGRKPYATVGAGQAVTILDVEDTGQSYVTIRHNGMAGYIARRDLRLNK